VVTHLLESRPHPEQGFRACLGIQQLARKYGAARLEAASARAVLIGAKSGRSVRSILQHGLDRQPVQRTLYIEPIGVAHDNVRGPDYFH
jgi:transposase